MEATTLEREYRIKWEVRFRLLAVEPGEADENCGVYTKLETAMRIARELKEADEKRLGGK